MQAAAISKPICQPAMSLLSSTWPTIFYKGAYHESGYWAEARYESVGESVWNNSGKCTVTFGAPMSLFIAPSALVKLVYDVILSVILISSQTLRV